MNISFPGSDVLFSTSPSLNVAGFGVLGLQNYGSSQAAGSGSGSGSSSSGSSSKVNPYQKAYDDIITASNAYLQNSLLNGPPATLPEYAAGGTAGSYASLNTLVAQLKNGLSQGFFSGTGTNVDASA